LAQPLMRRGPGRDGCPRAAPGQRVRLQRQSLGLVQSREIPKSLEPAKIEKFFVFFVPFVVRHQVIAGRMRRRNGLPGPGATRHLAGGVGCAGAAGAGCAGADCAGAGCAGAG